MVVFYLKNNLAPNGKVVPVTVSLNKEVIFPVAGSGFPNLSDPEGDGIWLLTLATTERDGNGNPIPPEFVNIVSEDTVHLEIEAALGRLGKKVDWGPLATDQRPPELFSITPALNQTTDVPILSNIIVRLKEPLPSAGIDLSTLNVRLNDFPVISGGTVQPGFNAELQGNIFDLTIIHRPRRLFGN